MRWAGAAFCLLWAGGAAAQGSIAPGRAHQVAALPGKSLDVFTYRPAGCQPGLLLLVFHGVQRNAADYRNHAEALADQVCAIVVAPEFDGRRFPQQSYQYGDVPGVPAGSRSIDLVGPLADWARSAAGLPRLPFILLGHSAGAQFLGRVAAFAPPGAAATILANPSTWVIPSAAAAAPFGFGGMGQDDAALRAYLAQKVTVLLGTADIGSIDLATGPQAMAQGPNRHERGLNAFHAAQAAAANHGWPFGWTLLEVAGVGHSATRMFGSAQAVQAVRQALPSAAGR